MKRCAYALAVLACAQLAQGVVIKSRVFGGGDATPGAYPWHVFVAGVENGIEISSCGATLISDTHVLTAAQCLVDSAQLMRVYLGAHNITASQEENRVVMESAKFVTHPDYDSAFYNNDLAIVTLPRAVVLSDFIGVANLPEVAEDTFVSTAGVFAGWGSSSGAINTMSSILQFSRNTVVENTDCVGHYGTNWMSDKKMCVDTIVADQGPCYGDAGGALVREDDLTVMGLFSFLDILTCTDGFAVGFTRVGPYLDWINGIIGK